MKLLKVLKTTDLECYYVSDYIWMFLQSNLSATTIKCTTASQKCPVVISETRQVEDAAEEKELRKRALKKKHRRTRRKKKRKTRRRRKETRWKKKTVTKTMPFP